MTTHSQSRAPEAAAQFGPVTVFFGERNGKYPDGNQVVVRGTDTIAAFDTPIVSNTLGAPFTQADLVILGHVHEDHMAGLHRLPRARVFAHDADVEAARSWPGLARHYGYAPATLERLKAKIERDFHYLPRPDCIAYPGGARWDLGGVRVHAVHMPGHTAGHCVLVVEPHGIAFIGDIDLTGFGPYYGDATSDLREFRRTLERIRDIDASVWITSHHRGVVAERTQFGSLLATFGARIDERERKLLGMLADGPQTLQALVERRLLYPVGYEELFVDDAERRSIAQHLEELRDAGRVAVDEDGRWHLT